MRNPARVIDGGPRRPGRDTHTIPERPRRGGALGRLALVLALGLSATAVLAAGPALETQRLDPARPANPGTETLLRFEVPDRSGPLEPLEDPLSRAAGARRGISLDCRSARELPMVSGLESALSGLSAATRHAHGPATRGGAATCADHAPRCHTLCTLGTTSPLSCSDTAAPTGRGRRNR